MASQHWINQNKVFLNLATPKLLAITAYGEAASDGVPGMQAVLNVIKNRVDAKSWYVDKSIKAITNSEFKAVILRPFQFSMYNFDDPVREKALAWAQNFDEKAGADPVFRTAHMQAKALVAGKLEDNTKGATHYYADYMKEPPFWVASMDYLGKVGTHLFYDVKRTRRDNTVLSLVLIAAIGLAVLFFRG